MYTYEITRQAERYIAVIFQNGVKYRNFVFTRRSIAEFTAKSETDYLNQVQKEKEYTLGFFHDMAEDKTPNITESMKVRRIVADIEKQLFAFSTANELEQHIKETFDANNILY